MKDRTNKNIITIQIFIFIFSCLLFIIKLIAWYITKSLSVLSDALESIVNIISSLIGIICLYISNFPKDIYYPYGYGKIEFLSSGIEGTLIIITGVFIILESFKRLLYNIEISNINYGIILIIFTSFINYIFGLISIKYGNKNNSIILISSGKHLLTDTYSSIGVTINLILINITKITYIDLIISLIYGSIIVYTGWKILIKSIFGIMDRTNFILLKKVKRVLINTTKKNENLSINNIKIISNRNYLHIDCIINLKKNIKSDELNNEINSIIKNIKLNFKEEIDFFFNINLLKKK